MSFMINPYIGGGGGGGGGGSHTYWRLRFPQGATGGSDNRMAAASVEFRATIGGADQCTGGTAFASSSLGGSAASNAFDANSGTVWQTTDNTHYNSHIGYQFASPVSVAQISVTAYAGTQYVPRSIMVESSDDGSTWTQEAYIQATLTWTSGETKNFTLASYPVDTAPSGYRYWKIEVTASNDGNGDILAQEIELRMVASGGDLTTPVIASSQASGSAGFYSGAEGPDKAFNDNTGDWWQPRLSGGLANCVWDFGSGLIWQLEQIQWTAHPSFLGRTPNAFKVYRSSDGSSWTEDWTPISCGTWSTSVRTFDKV